MGYYVLICDCSMCVRLEPASWEAGTNMGYTVALLLRPLTGEGTEQKKDGASSWAGQSPWLLRLAGIPTGEGYGGREGRGRGVSLGVLG